MGSWYESKMAIAVKWLGAWDVTHICERHFATKWKKTHKKIKQKLYFILYYIFSSEPLYSMHHYTTRKKNLGKNFLKLKGGERKIKGQYWVKDKLSALNVICALLNAWYQQIEWLTSHYFFTPLYPDLKWFVRTFWKMKNRNIYLLKLLYNDKNISNMLMYLNCAVWFMICICNTLLWILAAAKHTHTFSYEPILNVFWLPTDLLLSTWTAWLVAIRELLAL